MSKAGKKKAEQVAVEKASGKGTIKDEDRFIWSAWDSILLDFLNGINEARIETDRSQGNFAEILANMLRSNADLVTKVRDNHKIAERIVHSLPCGHRLCYDFIREVCQRR